MKLIFLLAAALATPAVLTAAGSRTGEPAALSVAALLEQRILEPDVPLTEVQAFCEARVPAMPKVGTREEWEAFATRTRREALDRIYLRGAKPWVEAQTKVEWLETIPGGPGYRIRKLRYEALPGLWIPALFYEPEAIRGKIPVHLAVNGHDRQNGKAVSYKQVRCINLARRGIASLNPEWLGMGQLATDGFRHSRLNQLDLCGISGLAPFYLAMSRGVDLLLAMPYADSGRVAVSGLSGGGWQTVTFSALDTRVTLCNPVAGYSSFKTRARVPSDLGDSEQTPCDLATLADYTHLTAMLAGRKALLTFNAKDDCCFAAGHALPPLLEAAAPIFQLCGAPEGLRSHVNFDPGTHNFEADNRQAFYRVVGETFFPGDARYSALEITSGNEVKTRAELDVPLPPDNLDLHTLAMAASQGLPRAAGTREQLAGIVRSEALACTMEAAGREARGEILARFWKAHLGETWTLPVLELAPQGEARGTTILVADGGRKSAAGEVEKLVAAGQRVVAVDLFNLGESKIPQRDYLFALLVGAVGARPLGIQASQLAALTGWARAATSQSVSVHSVGPRAGLAAQVAAALDPAGFPLTQTGALGSLHEILHNDWTVESHPELFCFGLLEAFDVPQLRRLAAARRPG